MAIEKTSQKYFPKAEVGRRAMALGTDFLAVWVLSSLLGSLAFGVQLAQILIFILVWFLLRVLLVYNNQGQSLGRWAFDMKVLEADRERGRIPSLLALTKREAIIGAGALGVSIALSNLSQNPTVILLVIPLVIDCSTAFSDREFKQALHDRFAGTMIVSSQRGYSLDIKVKRLVDIWRQNVRR
ncbi:MAG: RDD family protein [Calothrix sp. SM1_7_51]|nr:RDD family protein [Calothrix sp. SM1_7_51]